MDVDRTIDTDKDVDAMGMWMRGVSHLQAGLVKGFGFGITRHTFIQMYTHTYICTDV